MKVIEISSFGGSGTLRLNERKIPKPERHELLIKVLASGVNRADILQRMGKYPAPPGVSDLPGLEVCGEVVDGTLDESKGIVKGVRVIALISGGGYAQYVVAPVEQCLLAPSNLSDAEGASLPESLFTVWSNVFERGLLGKGEGGSEETLLVQGGTSGIGVIAIQLASAFGFRVFATAGNSNKCAVCMRLGAEKAINYREQDFVEIVHQCTADRGVDVILDIVGGDYIPRELKVLADGGRLVLISLLGGRRVDILLNDILFRRLTITGSTLRNRSIGYKAKIATNLRSKVLPMIESSLIKPVIYKIFPAYKVSQAHDLMESGTHIGKIVLVW